MIGDSYNTSAFGYLSGQTRDRAYQMARDDFRIARRRAATANLLGRLTGKSLELLSFREVTQKLKEAGRHNLGLQDIPLAAIVGSVGRTRDFDRNFLPLQQEDAERWARVKVAGMGEKGLPPIEVYKIGESYFVLDGNHRVSIARQQGMETISAMVVEVQTRAPLPADAQPDDLILGAEYADFLEYTQLDKMKPEVDLRVSVPGLYKKLEIHIAVHRCYIETNEAQMCRTVPEAASYWYDEAYLPLIETIRERGILRDFPGLTETDLYLWITENQEQLRDELGWQIKPTSVLNNLAGEIGRGSQPLHIRRSKHILGRPKTLKRKSRSSQKKWMQQRFLDRYSESLFADILVPVSGDFDLATGVQRPLKQALVVALHEGEDGTEDDREGIQLLGLTSIEDSSLADDVAILTIRDTFETLCREAGVDGALSVEEGNLVTKISERAIMADLIVIDREFPFADQKGTLELLRSLNRANRPVLLTGELISPLEKPLLTLTGKAEIDTTLFLATYLAEQWGSELIVLSETKREDQQAGEIGRVQKYLALHEVEAPFLFTDELKTEVILDTANTQVCDLIVMNWPATGRIIDHSPDDIIELVQDVSQPILICP